MKIIFFYGPPAVGKLTIAKILSQKIGYKLLHNHLLVNPIVEIFPFENPSSRLLTREFRLRIIEEAIKGNINLITTFGIAGNHPFAHVKEVIDLVKKYGMELCLVHLTARKDTLLNRVDDISRKKHSKNLSKEKLEEIIKDNDDIFSKLDGVNHLTLDTSTQPPEKSVDKIISYYSL
ncbi:MAG TPA: AAA family ATPase [Patescibacteria group bacterium]